MIFHGVEQITLIMKLSEDILGIFHLFFFGSLDLPGLHIINNVLLPDIQDQFSFYTILNALALFGSMFEDWSLLILDELQGPRWQRRSKSSCTSRDLTHTYRL